MSGEEKNKIKNPEGYVDTTPYKAIRHIEAVEVKACHVYETILHVAKLAGFKVAGTVKMIDRNGRVHDGEELRKAYRDVQGVQQVRQDT